MDMQKADKFFEKIGLEWQYVLISRTYPYRFKVGISGTFDARIRDVRASISQVVGKPVHVACAFKLPVFFAKANEKAIHRCLLWHSAKIAPGSSGHTEWAWSLNVFVGLVVWIVCFGFDWPRWPSALVMLLPIPLDLIIFTSLLAFFQYTIAGLALYGIWNLFF